jgi:UDP-MurNAc hydroxylase
MLIDYVGNTGFLVTLQSGEKIALDWWMSSNAFHGAWAVYPPLSQAERAYYLELNKPDYVFVSHLHTDHLDPQVLCALDPQTPVIIGKRAHPHLSRSLRGLGLKNIVEVEFEQEKSFGSFSVVLFDDFSADQSAPTDQVGYQLDCAIQIKDRDGVSFFNLNDDVPSRAQAERIAAEFGRPDAVAIASAGASSYPQCFLNYDDAQMAEKKRFVVQKTAGRFFDVMSGLRPRVAIPCGGAVLNGVLADRTRFAQIMPDPEEMTRRRGELPEGTDLVLLEARDRLDLRPDGQSVEKGREAPVSISTALTEAAERQLDHEMICIPESFRVLLPVMLRRARQRLWSQQQRLDLFPDWLVTLRVEPLGAVRDGDTLGSMQLSYTFDLKSPEADAEADESRQHIEFVVDARLLLMVLISGTVWNNIYTSSLVQTRRNPDVQDMNVTKLMSFFAV